MVYTLHGKALIHRKKEKPHDSPMEPMVWNDRGGGSFFVRSDGTITQAARNGIPEGVAGWGGFYGSEFWIDPENRIVAVFMAQVYDLPRRDEIVRRFGSEVFRTLRAPTGSE